MVRRLLAITLAVVGAAALPQAQSGPGTAAFEAETLKHFQALLRRDTSSPPGNEVRAVEYLREVLDAVGISAIDLSGWEADDIIATATDRLVEAGHQVIIDRFLQESSR